MNTKRLHAIVYGVMAICISAGSVLLGQNQTSQVGTVSNGRNPTSEGAPVSNGSSSPRQLRTAPSRVPPDPGGPAKEIASLLDAQRPLEAAVTELQFFGIPLPYEEPVWRTARPDLPGTRSSLLLRYEVDAATNVHLRTPMETVLKEIVSRHDGKSPGEFRVLDLGLGRGFSIIPVAVNDGSGQRIAALSPLDVRVTLESKKRTAAQALDDLMAAVSTSAGVPVVIFRSFMDSGLIQEGHSPEMYEFAAKDEVARDVLNRLLYKVFPGKMAWRLFYQPPPIQNSQTTEARGRGLGPGMSTLPPRQGAFFAFSLVPVFRATDSQIGPTGGRNIEDVPWENWKPD